MLPKAYQANQYEDEIYQKWEDSGTFKANNQSSKKGFTISLPPPNATGTLHAGHAVMLALEDIMIRYARMKGYEALWIPGTDHAAIATESVVIRQVQEKEGIKDARSLGREALLGRIANFVAGSQDTIRKQVRKMGASCDWSRERYTMDAALNRCVNDVFTRMYNDGLMYRGKRVVNWDVALQTTLSDDEVEHEERDGVLYTFEYLSAEQTGGEPVYVGTSRPETKLGDTAIAVHPDDERYQHLVGKDFEVVWPGGQRITVTVIADQEIDPEFGTGALGVTPFHSKIDYEMWKRHKADITAEPIEVIDEQGKLTKNIQGYEGLSVFQAREKFVEELRNAGKLKEEKKYKQQMSISYRSKKVVEALPKEQWFLDVNKKVVDWKGKKMSLKEVMLDVVKSGDIQIIPNRFEKTYFHWINNLQDWCVSRQIWWGHRIPAWNRDEEVHVGVNPPEGEGWKQDEDTLDTWFSSALWTWSTLIDQELALDTSVSLEELLERSPDYQKFHPTQVLETGYDILFFWVARMVLMTTYATGQIPFEKVYLHGMVRTRAGKKMSKSDPKTCIDPLDVIEKYGADALRLSLMMGNTPGNDMVLYDEKIKGSRNFTNKLWNASRFVLGIFEEKGITSTPEIDYEHLSDADEWILSKLNDVIEKVDEGLENYQMSPVSEVMYSFVWDDFCDWYLELSKGEKQNPAVLYHVLKTMLILLHPFVPFVTEVLWSHLPGAKGMLIHQQYPQVDGREYNSSPTNAVLAVIQKIRNLRAENKIEPVKKVNVVIWGHDYLEDLHRSAQDIIRLARCEDFTLMEKGEKIANAASDVVQGIEIFIPLEGLVDTQQEKARLAKEIQNLEGYVKGLEAKLGNDNFVKNAPQAVVNGEREKLGEAKGRLEALKGQLEGM